MPGERHRREQRLDVNARRHLRDRLRQGRVPATTARTSGETRSEFDRFGLPPRLRTRRLALTVSFGRATPRGFMRALATMTGAVS